MNAVICVCQLNLYMFIQNTSHNTGTREINHGEVCKGIFVFSFSLWKCPALRCKFAINGTITLGFNRFSHHLIDYPLKHLHFAGIIDDFFIYLCWCVHFHRLPITIHLISDIDLSFLTLFIRAVIQFVDQNIIYFLITFVYSYL